MCQSQIGTKATVGLLDQVFNLFDHAVRCADHTETTVNEIDHFIDVAALDSHLRKRCYVLEISEPLLHAVFHIITRLLLGFSQVH